ncbi:YitT family protein [Alteromonas sp. 1_MG-2023]|uniref:YitT family protein n=1 Tax=Alteromonas sp. 1_MG-2023 TaxID=3062669 RepID=UPI0026E20675|nr:YitT family protein [Alteromonas sp. 1_MG-2023]MDO6568969.1 YitT family protein [Alteromonas sp. 1_MG-2023]
MQNSNHSVIEDIFALVSAGLFVAFGVFLFQSQDLMIGGAAGIALLGTYAIDIDFGVLFFLINVPFYTLAWTRISKRFTLNTFISVTTVSVLTEQIPAFIDITSINPIFAAILGGLLIGVGMLIMFRHSSSLGGLGIVAFYLQSRFNIRAGTFQLTVDSVILLCGLFFIPWPLVLISILAAFCLNMVISLNHRPERYIPAKKNLEAPQGKNAQNGVTSPAVNTNLHAQNN